MFCKKGVLRNFAKFTGKHLCRNLFFNKVAMARKSSKLYITTKTSKNTKIYSLTLRDFYEVLRIDENNYVEDENEDTAERKIISERNN